MSPVHFPANARKIDRMIAHFQVIRPICPNQELKVFFELVKTEQGRPLPDAGIMAAKDSPSPEIQGNFNTHDRVKPFPQQVVISASVGRIVSEMGL